MKQPKPPIHVESATALVAECDAIVRIVKSLEGQGLEGFTVAIASSMLDNLKRFLAHCDCAVDLLPPEAGMAAGGRSCTISVTWKTLRIENGDEPIVSMPGTYRETPAS